jgi:Arc/MetJ-type ribon-helix-helix transcriptional regulator
MTAKITISLPDDLLAEVRRRVEAGEAATVSGFIAQTLRAAVTDDSLEAFVASWIAEAGEPGDEARAWAEEAWRSADRAAEDPPPRWLLDLLRAEGG